MAYLSPFEVGSSPSSGSDANGVPTPDKMRSTAMANELLSVKHVDRDRIRLLARREIAAVLPRERRTGVHTVRLPRFRNFLSESESSRTHFL
jgi:hypothetical protein